MNAFPGGSLASVFSRTISCWHGSGNCSLKMDSSTNMSVETQSTYLMLWHDNESPNNVFYPNLYYGAELKDLLFMMICALLSFGWIPACMNWIFPWCSNTWHVPAIGHIILYYVGKANIVSVGFSNVVVWLPQFISQANMLVNKPYFAVHRAEPIVHKSVSAKFQIYISWPWLWCQMSCKCNFRVCSTRKKHHAICFVCHKIISSISKPFIWRICCISPQNYVLWNQRKLLVFYRE